MVVDLAADKKPLIIWDSLRQFFHGDENVSGEVRQFLDKFRPLCRFGATVLILHHTGKGEHSRKYRGSSDIQAAIDTGITLERVAGDGVGVGQLVVSPFKDRLFPMKKFTIQLEADYGFRKIADSKQERKADLVERAVLGIVSKFPKLNQSGIISAAGKINVAKHDVLRVLKNKEVFSKIRGERNEWLYTCVGDEDRLAPTFLAIQ